eukprot:TRINITY_DN506_c0_g2_i1.p2 TRINITY_DN506_c0_g2~~TRINITY_DN506_c0_g2_i1.p2  ORF type:complete len:152 (-),score=36.23 TRINITY_DN506_c0_g2_i1:112-567(-)
MSDFTEYELAEYKDAFSLFDANHDGDLNSKELTQLMRGVGFYNFSDGDSAKFMKEAGFNNDRVDFNGFLQIISKFVEKKKAGSEDELMAAFELFDKDHKGVVSVGEMRHVLTSLGLKLTDEEGEEFVRDADVGGHGQIKYHEFVKMMLYSK